MNSHITSISQDQLDALFNDTAPENVATITQPVTQVSKEETTETKPVIPQEVSNEIKVIDIDNIDLDADAIEDDTEEDPKKEKDSKEDTEEREVVPVSDEEKAVLKRTIDFLIESGRWKDFEGRDELDVDDETFAKIALEQDRTRVEDMFYELVDSTGVYGKAIIAHIKDGGNPDDIIDLFKEQKQIQSIDTTDFEGKVAVIEKYYSDVVGWKPAKIEKHLKLLAEKGEEEIGNEFQEVSEEFDTYYNEQLAQIEQEREEKRKEDLKRKEQFVNDIKTVVTSRPDFTDKDKKLIENSLLKFKNKLPNGQVVNDFYIEFAKMQQDPEAYVDLVLLTMDRNRFKKEQKVIEQKKEATEAFKFIKGGSAIKKKITAQDSDKKDNTKQTKTDFSVIFK